ncbi:hypothetical protein GLYMA_18G097966v4 [Glycine max]|nr:hypothetical protein GLYMA_18G097966v4 [Glycine max]KAG4377373.1 hypothetical protein GLYMA_18G097966v4 [Glycine max]KAH1153915.1 hypothetical protein GYH30_049517 [Glycine max]KAH1153916.1 hypothetical protein GYH30_049517 [Glycine max]
MIPLETIKLKMIHSSRMMTGPLKRRITHCHFPLTTLMKMQLFAWMVMAARFAMGWLLLKEILISIHQ